MQDSRYDEPGMGQMLSWFIIFVLVIGLIGGGFWAFRVATSDIKGRGDSKIIKNSANNRIAASEAFEDLITEIKATDTKLELAAASMKATPGDLTIRTQYTGLVNHCFDSVGKYNAAARKYTKAEFKASDLPPVIDKLDPATDCKETAP